jgi:DNA-binding transcriptional LysR family regulator
MNTIKLNQLEMLVAVVDAGGFSAAAAELGCAQSRISHAIAELEQALGARLLVRSRTGCWPSEAGHQIVAKARQMLRIAESMFASMQEDSGLAGRVRLACFRSAGTALLPHTLEALAQAYPSIQVDIDDGCTDYHDVVQAVRQGVADIGVTRGPVDDPQLLSQPFICDPYVLLVPASLKLTHPVTWAQLSSTPFIQASNPGAAWILEQCRAAGFEQAHARRLASDSGIIALVRKGLGFSIFPRLATFPEPNGVQVLDLPIRAKRHLILLTKPETARIKVVKTVLRYLRDKPVLMKTEAFRAGIISFDY